MWLAVVQPVNVLQLVRVCSIQWDDFSDPLLELENGVYLEVVVQEKDLRGWVDVVDNKLFLVGNNLEDVIRELILELPKNDISQLRDDSEIDIDGGPLRNLVEDLSQNVDQERFIRIIIVEVDDFLLFWLNPLMNTDLSFRSIFILVLIKRRIVLRFGGTITKFLKPCVYYAEY